MKICSTPKQANRPPTPAGDDPAVSAPNSLILCGLAEREGDAPVGIAGMAPGRDGEPLAGPAERPREIGGRDGPDPTRYGDWEIKGRCIDF